MDEMIVPLPGNNIMQIGTGKHRGRFFITDLDGYAPYVTPSEVLRAIKEHFPLEWDKALEKDRGDAWDEGYRIGKGGY